MDFAEWQFVKMSSRAVVPTRATKYSIGLDLHSPDNDLIRPKKQVLIPTQIKLGIPPGYYGSAMKYISTLHSIITIGSSYIFRNNYNTCLQFHIVYCRDEIQHKVQVTIDIVCSTSQLHMMLLV